MEAVYKMLVHTNIHTYKFLLFVVGLVYGAAVCDQGSSQQSKHIDTYRYIEQTGYIRPAGLYLGHLLKELIL